MDPVVVVGAGISGLTVAYRLSRLDPGVPILVLERAGRPGGTVWTERHADFLVEMGPNAFPDAKPSTLALSRELGLGDRLVAANESVARNRYIWLNDKLRPLPNGLWAFLGSDLLSWRGKLDLLAEPLRSRRRAGGDETVAAFARRRAGREAAEVLGDALVTGIYAGDPAILSLRATFPRLAAFEADQGGVLRGLAAAARKRRHAAAERDETSTATGRLWSFREGLRVLIEALCGQLPTRPVLGVRVRSVERAASGTWTVRAEGQDRWQAAAVVLACPAYQQAGILSELDPVLADAVGGIAYNRVAVVALGYRGADIPGGLSGFGYIAPQRTRRDVLGVQWCSAIFSRRAGPGLALVRAMCGGWNRPDVVGWDDERLLAAVRVELRQTMGVTAPPVFHLIIRWERAIPQYRLGHLERLSRIQARAARHPGLFLMGNAYHGVALNDCTEQGVGAAERVRAYLGRPAAAGGGGVVR
jgi:oxygen-dependent protoporphyrinogen oxidase